MLKNIILATLLLSFFQGFSQKYDPDWKSLDSRPMPEWFSDAKFGIFIHWGVYSVPAWRKLEPGRYASYAEWYYARVLDNKKNGGYEFHRKNYGEDFEYRDFAPMFKAELFDADLWADIFKESGAKYVVLTSKHHDGYCLWPTKNKHKVNWNSGDSGPEKDLVGELTKAVRAKGMKMGLYYSIPDWESVPRKIDGSEYYIRKEFVDKYGIGVERYRDEILLPQLKELVNNYKPSVIFSDAGEWIYDDEFWKTKEFLAWLYNESPSRHDVVVNDRFCKGMPGKHGDYFSSEYKDADDGSFQKYWEENRGIGSSYGFNRAENLNDYNTSEELLLEFLDIVSRGGNLLLNVGPTADGRIPVIMQERLADIGSWLEVNGAAIYGTSKREITKQGNEEERVFFTKKDQNTFAIFTNWPDEILSLNLLPEEKVKNVSLLGYDGEIVFEQKDDQLIIQIPQLNINQIPCNWAWSLKIEMK